MIRRELTILTSRWIVSRSYLKQYTPNVKEIIAKRYRTLIEDAKLKNKKVDPKNVIAFESLAAERYIKSIDQELFTKVTEHQKESLKQLTDEYNDNHDEPTFPMANTASVNFISENGKKCYDLFTNPQMEKGFHVRGDELVQEYREGYVGELENDDLTVPEVTLHGPEDAVERIDFQLPGQASVRSLKKLDLKAKETTMVEALPEEKNIEADIPPSNKVCAGCGANFQCNNTSLPGFIPYNTFTEIEKSSRYKNKSSGNTYNNTLCRRCYLLKEHNFLLNVSVSPLDYEEMIGGLKIKEALILLVVDVTDLPYSIYDKLPDIIGHGKPIIVIGNKVDLLPPDARDGYLKNFSNVLYKALQDTGLKDKFNIIHIALVSAKTGYGIEQLITQIYLKWTDLKDSIRSDIYLLGNTNAGKSSIFNIFLQSDLCKVRAMDLVERACASPWPGTTMSLLKFPVMNLSPQKLEIRRRRLLSVQAWLKKEERNRLMLLRETKDPKYATLMGVVDSSFKSIDAKHQPESIQNVEAAFGHDVNLSSRNNEEREKFFNPDDPTFAKGTWCYDTPGVVNESQLMNIFTLDELIKIFPRKIMTPRTFILREEQSLLVGGVVEFMSKDTTVLVTLFCSEKLPANIMRSDDVKEFLDAYLGKPNLVVPCGNQKRMDAYPKFEGQTFEIQGKGMEKGACDITISSIGWLMVTSKKEQKNTITVKTPGGKGIFLRDLPMLPYSLSFRGSRIGGTQEYKTKTIPFLKDSEEQKGNGKEHRKFRNNKRL
uniref:Nitric oxide-associated protein 1 (inferred by orthology to a human protein) n=1 Tax=Strongyloides venezuelensis TaxID=75913 RepID=A0A0K0EWB9_STRVS